MPREHRQRPREQPTAEHERKTRRMVLRRVRVLEIPPDVSDEMVGQAILSLASPTRPEPIAFDAWVECGEFDGLRQVQAVEAYAGKPGTPDAMVGEFKAPPLSGWKGGVVHEKPPEPFVQRRLID